MGVKTLKNEIAKKYEQNILTKELDEKDLPILIGEQVDKLNQLDKSIKKAINSANNAKEKAERAKRSSAGFGKKKAAIEELQFSGLELAKAVEESTDAQRVSFEFQTKLAEISKYLFGLGVSNIASNRFVVRELELKLKGASQKELSKLAQQEIITVVKQLKEQEDLLIRLECLTKNVKKQDSFLQVQRQLNQENDRKFEEHVKINLRYDEQWNRQLEESKKIAERLVFNEKNLKKQNKRLEDHQKVNNHNSEKLKKLSVADKNLEEKIVVQSKIIEEQKQLFNKFIDEQVKRLSDLDKQDSVLSENITNNRKLHDEQEQKISKLTEEVDNLKIQLETKTSHKISMINFSVAILAVILSSVHFFI